MARLRLIKVLCVLFCWAACPVQAGENQKAPRDLIEYIEDAKRLGLKESEIQQSAIAAGWNKDKVVEAMAVARHLDNTGTSTPANPSMPPRRNVSEPAGYKIGSGDQLQIVVWKEPEASVPLTVVRADGKISVPLIKEVPVAGLTVTEAEALLSERLGKFIRGVDVTVIVKEITSLRVYLVGAVKKEGPIPLLSSMNVLQALTAGGGLTDFAKRKKIYVLRSEGGKKIRMPFDYDAVIRGDKSEQNALLRSEDTIVVP